MTSTYFSVSAPLMDNATAQLEAMVNLLYSQANCGTVKKLSPTSSPIRASANQRSVVFSLDDGG